MTSTLYRKYRPQTFSEVVGQEHVTLTLENQIKTGKLAHAYLFCGMRGVGKTTLARLLAKAVNCEKRKEGKSEPCDECASCVGIREGRSLDLLEMDAASNRRIDDIREVREHIPYGPTKSRYKVVIIDEVHMLTTEAFNALLKTLEEPPSHVIFVLCTTEVHKLPETIVSRCQRFDFRRLTAEQLQTRLNTLTKAEGIKVDSDVIGQIVQLAGGSTRDAESYLGKLLSLGDKHITAELAQLVLPRADLELALKFLELIVKRETREAVLLLNTFVNEGGDIGYLYRQVTELLRKVLLVKLGGSLPDYAAVTLEKSAEQRVVELANNITSSRLQGMLDVWLAVEGSWRSSEVWQLPLELAAVKLAENGLSPAKQEPNAAPPPVKTVFKKPLVAKTTNTSPSDGVQLSVVTDNWNGLVARIRELNHSLSFILSVAHPVKIESGVLTISFQYKLHQERMRDPKIRQVIEQTLLDVLGAPLTIVAVVEEQPSQGDLLSSVLTTFGGQLVD